MQGARRGAEREEHDRESGDEKESVDERLTARTRELVQAELRDEGDVAGDQRQDARREEREEPGA